MENPVRTPFPLRREGFVLRAPMCPHSFHMKSIKAKQHYAKAKAYAKRNKALNSTPAVLALEAKLKALGLNYQREAAFVLRPSKKHPKGYLFIVDFLLPGKVVIEVDGGYHTAQEQQAKDKWRDSLLLSIKFRGGMTASRVIRITNQQALDPLFDLQQVIKAG